MTADAGKPHSGRQTSCSRSVSRVRPRLRSAQLCQLGPPHDWQPGAAKGRMLCGQGSWHVAVGLLGSPP